MRLMPLTTHYGATSRRIFINPLALAAVDDHDHITGSNYYACKPDCALASRLYRTVLEPSGEPQYWHEVTETPDQVAELWHQAMREHSA